MNTPQRFAELVQTFFCDYLIKQRDLSPRTVSAYRDTFRLLLNFLQRDCGKRRVFCFGSSVRRNHGDERIRSVEKVLGGSEGFWVRGCGPGAGGGLSRTDPLSELRHGTSGVAVSTVQRSGRYLQPCPALLSNQNFLSHSVVADATQCGGLALQFPGDRAGRKAFPCNQR